MGKVKDLEWLNREIKKDDEEIRISKEKLIESIKTVDKKMFYTEPEKKKLTFKQKILKILGYGK